MQFVQNMPLNRRSFPPSMGSLSVQAGDQAYLVFLTVGLRSNSRYSSRGLNI